MAPAASVVARSYLYCVVSGDRLPPPELTGIDGAAVRGVPADGVTLWVSDADDHPAPTVEHVREHDAVCAAAMTIGATVAPMRFANLFADDAASLTALAPSLPGLRRTLATLDGAVEMSVLLPLGAKMVESAVHPRGSAAAPGRQYLENLAERYRLERLVQTELSAPEAALAEALAGIPRASRRRVDGGAAPALVLSHLVPRDRIEEYRERVAAVAGSGALPAHLVSGPNAPYSFVDGAR